SVVPVNRHRVRRWEQSQLTNKPHNSFFLLVTPTCVPWWTGSLRCQRDRCPLASCPPLWRLQAHLRTELVAAVVPRQPDAVVVLAPSNNLTTCRGLEDSSADFAALVKSARKPLVQRVPFHHIAENFPLRQRDLWARDGTHLSDNVGMPILAYLLWQAADRQLAEPEPEPSHPCRPWPACPYRPRFCHPGGRERSRATATAGSQPRRVGYRGSSQKRSLPEAELAALDAQVVQKKVVLKGVFHSTHSCEVQPNLAACCGEDEPVFLSLLLRWRLLFLCTSRSERVAAKRRTVVARRRLAREQVDTAVSEVAVSKPVNAVPVCREDEATHHAVDLTSEPGLSVPLPVRGGDEVVH
ncbi:hypothetical protein GBF38_008227, partial [Nibea albiflora]